MRLGPESVQRDVAVHPADLGKSRDLLLARGVPPPLVWPELHHPTVVIAEVDSIYYGLALLRSQLVYGALICARAAANAAVEGRWIASLTEYLSVPDI